jgi:hypothetical protein
MINLYITYFNKVFAFIVLLIKRWTDKRVSENKENEVENKQTSFRPVP